MVTLKHELSGLSITLDQHDINYLIKLFKFSKTDDIDYSYNKSAVNYQNNGINWVKIETSREPIILPYDLVHDYRKIDQQSDWGTFYYNGEYKFPADLLFHKDQKIEEYHSKKFINRNTNQACPRVSKFSIEHTSEKGLQPHYLIERAYYNDQVGTNLTIDAKFKTPIVVNDQKCITVRQWDQAQSRNIPHKLPMFEESRLANTIGVVLGITVRDDYSGMPMILRRLRSYTVGPYRGMWTHPCGFALSMDPGLQTRKSLDVRDFLISDLRMELHQEMGLEIEDFDYIKPIAFCRDLPRGGKPQFFLEGQCNIPWSKLKRIVKKEYQKKVEYKPKKLIAEPFETMLRTQNKETFSPELACHLALSINNL